jgi:nucleotide-binding universal stress UspA family protein
MPLDLYLPIRTYPDPIAQQGLEAAVAVARHVGGSITAAGVEVDIPDLKNKLAEALIHLQDKIREAERASQANAERLISELCSLAERSGVPVMAELYRAHPALMDDAIVKRARFHHTIILPLPAEDMAARGTAEALVFGSGRPVILLPVLKDMPVHLDTIVLATDFGRVSARAMFDAQPFLERAKKIYAVTVSDEKDVSHGDRAALVTHFQRYGLTAELVELESGGRAAGNVIQEYAKNVGAGLLVMGAFGHSRMRDFVLGGVTKSVLSHLRQPVLLSY